MNSKTIKFTIAIPAYKPQFLKECIDSILSQNYSNFEIIIVNDASPYDIDSIVYQYSDNRIRYYKNQVNCGAIHVVDNWNKCLDYSTGDYIICMGDDDKLMPCCLDEYAKLIHNYPYYHLYHAWTQIINENSIAIDMQEPRPIKESVYSLMYFRLVKYRMQFIGDFLFEVKKLKQNGGFFNQPLAWASDDISAWIAAKEKGVINSQIPLFQYRINSQTITNNGIPEEIFKALERREKWIKDFFKKEPSDDLDKLYYNKIKDNTNYRIKQLKQTEIKLDIYRHGILRFLYWLNNCRKYNISKVRVIYAFIEQLKMKLR